MLWILLAIVALISIFLVILFYMPVDIRVYFERMNSDDKGSLELKTLFGILRMRRQLHEVTTDVTSNGPTVRVKASSKDQEASEGSLSLGQLPQMLKYIGSAAAVGRRMLPILNRTCRRIHVKEISFDADIGLSDAVYTGVAVGMAFAIIEGIFGWLSHHTQFEEMPHVRIHPAYNQKVFQVRTEGIMRIRFGYAISASIRLWLAWKRRT